MSWIPTRRALAWFLSATFLSFLSGVLGAQQKMNNIDMERTRGMLHDARDAVKKHYYDPKYHGVDLDARYQQFDERIKTAPDLNNGLRMGAAFLSGLKDSHTFFDPPTRAFRLDSGFRMELLGDHAFISRVRPGTDAESKVHAGDQVIRYETYSVNRVDFQDLSYTYNNLMPQMRTQLDLAIRTGIPGEFLLIPR